MATCSPLCPSSAAAGAELLLSHKVEGDAASSTASTCGPALTRSNSVETSLSEVIQEHIDQPEHHCMQLEGEARPSNGMTFAQKRFRIRMGEEPNEELVDAAMTSQATGADSSLSKETDRAKVSFAERRFNIQMLDAEVAEPLEGAVQHADVKEPALPKTSVESLAQKRFAIRMGRDMAEEMPVVAGEAPQVHQHRAPTAMAASSHRRQEPSTQEARGVPLAQKRFEIRMGSSAGLSSASSAVTADKQDDAAACVSVVAPSFAQVRWAVRSQGEEHQGSMPPAVAAPAAAAAAPQQQPRARAARRGHFKGFARMQDFDM